MPDKTVRLDGLEFSSHDVMSRSFEVRKAMRRTPSFLDVKRFETETYLSVISVLSNKIIKIQTMSETPSGLSSTCSIEDGVFNNIADVEPMLKKLLCVDASIFGSFIDSARLFHDSLITREANYSVAFVLLVFSLENIPNRIYTKRESKRRKLIRFAKKFVTSDIFTQNEIRQLEFNDPRRLNALFERLLSQCYQFRCDYTHDAKMISPLSQIAERLSMAFISNDQVSIFPSYSWLRKITHIALTHFLAQEPCKGKNSIDSYFDSYETGSFKAKKAIQQGQFLTDSDVYLQQLGNFGVW